MQDSASSSMSRGQIMGPWVEKKNWCFEFFFLLIISVFWKLHIYFEKLHTFWKITRMFWKITHLFWKITLTSLWGQWLLADSCQAQTFSTTNSSPVNDLGLEGAYYTTTATSHAQCLAPAKTGRRTSAGGSSTPGRRALSYQSRAWEAGNFQWICAFLGDFFPTKNVATLFPAVRFQFAFFQEIVISIGLGFYFF